MVKKSTPREQRYSFSFAGPTDASEDLSILSESHKYALLFLNAMKNATSLADSGELQKNLKDLPQDQLTSALRNGLTYAKTLINSDTSRSSFQPVLTLKELIFYLNDPISLWLSWFNKKVSFSSYREVNQHEIYIKNIQAYAKKTQILDEELQTKIEASLLKKFSLEETDNSSLNQKSLSPTKNFTP